MSIVELELAKRRAFAVVRAREVQLITEHRFADPYGKDHHQYNTVKANDAEHVRLLAAFNAARDAWQKAKREHG